MAGRIDNWSELERLYVVEGKTHREIARIAGCSNSSVSQKAKRDDWEGKRIAYKAALSRRGYEMTAESVAHEQQEVRRESILVSRAYIRTFATQLAEGKVQTNAKDTLEFIRFLAGEMDPAKGEGLKDGPKVIEGNAVAVGGNEEFLRRIVDVARTRLAAGRGVGGDLLGESPGTLKN
jgi:hypothetical protein